jgi:hypothetical protein
VVRHDELTKDAAQPLPVAGLLGAIAAGSAFAVTHNIPGAAVIGLVAGLASRRVMSRRDR